MELETLIMNEVSKLERIWICTSYIADEIYEIENKIKETKYKDSIKEITLKLFNLTWIIEDLAREVDSKVQDIFDNVNENTGNIIR